MANIVDLFRQPHAKVEETGKVVRDVYAKALRKALRAGKPQREAEAIADQAGIAKMNELAEKLAGGAKS